MRFRHVLAVLVSSATLAGVLATAPAAVADQPVGADRAGPPPTELILQWYDLTKQTVAAAAFPEQATQGRTWAVSWIAAARAIGSGNRSADQQNAAFATALHDSLVAQVPSQQATLDAALSATLGSIADSRAKDRGVDAGHRAATEELADRQGDGFDTASVNIPYTPPPAGPGVYQLTPPTFGPAVRAGLPNAESFLLRTNDQFRPPPPPALTSATYLDSLAEVRAIGQDTSTVRTPEQLDVALFWEQSSIGAYVQVLRSVLADSTKPLLDQVQLVAVFHAATLDAQIAIHEAKYTYVFWRPVTAIRTGSVDVDPTWTPLFATPRHPDYPSGHAGYAGAAEVVLDALVGRPANPVAVTSTTEPGVTHYFSDWKSITQENVDGRVWEGIHFRFSDETGVDVGKKVARNDLLRLAKLFVPAGSH